MSQFFLLLRSHMHHIRSYCLFRFYCSRRNSGVVIARYQMQSESKDRPHLCIIGYQLLLYLQ